MHIDRLKIANGFKAANINPELAEKLAVIFGEELERASRDMASLKDIDLISEKTRANFAEASLRQTFWIVGVGFAILSAIIGLKIFG